MLSFLSFSRMRGFGLGAPRQTAAERRAAQQAAQAQRQAEAAARRQQQQAEAEARRQAAQQQAAQRQAEAAARRAAQQQAQQQRQQTQQVNRAAQQQQRQAQAAERKATQQQQQATRKAAQQQKQAERKQVQAQRKATQQAKQAERKADREAKRRMRVGGKDVDIPASEVGKVQQVVALRDKLKQDVANAKARLATKPRKRPAPGRLKGLGAATICDANGNCRAPYPWETSTPIDPTSWGSTPQYEGPGNVISADIIGCCPTAKQCRPNPRTGGGECFTPRGKIRDCRRRYNRKTGGYCLQGLDGRRRNKFQMRQERIRGGRPANLHPGYLDARHFSGLGEDVISMDGSPIPADPTANIAPIDPGAIGVPMVPQMPTMPAPTGYEKRKAKGRLRPIDMIYELSAATQAQLAFLINEILALNRELLTLLAQLNEGGTVEDPANAPVYDPIAPIDPNTGMPIYDQFQPPTIQPGYYDPTYFAPPPPPGGYVTESPMTEPGFGPSPFDFSEPAQFSDPFSQMTMGPAPTPYSDYAPGGGGLTPMPSFDDPEVETPGVVSEWDLFQEQAPPPPAMEYPADSAPVPETGADFYGDGGGGLISEDDLFSGSLFGLGDCKCAMR